MTIFKLGGLVSTDSIFNLTQPPQLFIGELGNPLSMHLNAEPDSWYAKHVSPILPNIWNVYGVTRNLSHHSHSDYGDYDLFDGWARIDLRHDQFRNWRSAGVSQIIQIAKAAAISPETLDHDSLLQIHTNFWLTGHSLHPEWFDWHDEHAKFQKNFQHIQIIPVEHRVLELRYGTSRVTSYGDPRLVEQFLRNQPLMIRADFQYTLGLDEPGQHEYYSNSICVATELKEMDIQAYSLNVVDVLRHCGMKDEQIKSEILNDPHGYWMVIGYSIAIP